MHTKHWLAQRSAERACNARTHEQRTREARATRVGNDVDAVQTTSRLAQDLLCQRQDAPDVIARRQLRHHPTVGLVHVDLAVQCMGQQARHAACVCLDKCYARLIARRLNTQNFHRPSVPSTTFRSERTVLSHSFESVFSLKHEEGLFPAPFRRTTLRLRAAALDATANNDNEPLGNCMKEYRLIAWADLPAPYHRTAYRRMLTDLSHRHMSMAQLVACSGIRRQEVKQFLDMLDAQGLLNEREVVVADSVFDSLRPLGGWIRKALATSAGNH